MCKITFASKLIAEVLLPAFLTKDPEIQDQITKIVPAIACMSLGTYAIVLGHSTFEGHSIFYNKALDISIICYNCHNKDNLAKNDFLNNIKKEHMVLYKESVQITTSQQSTFNGLRNLLCKFLNRKQYISVENSQYWKLLERLCNHYYVFKYGLTTEIINEENLKYIFKAIKPLIPHKEVSIAVFN